MRMTIGIIVEFLLVIEKLNYNCRCNIRFLILFILKKKCESAGEGAEV